MVLAFSDNKDGSEQLGKIIVRTSEEGWYAKLVLAIKDEKAVVLIDDAKVGISETDTTLAQLGLDAKISKREWVACGSCLGMSAVGIGLLVFAAVDPEPTSKLAVLIVGGVLLVATGAAGPIVILTKKKIKIKAGTSGFEVIYI